VSCEAVTPGEFQSRGEGLTIRYGFHPTPFGQALLAVTDRGICALAFCADGRRAGMLEQLKSEWENAVLVEDGAETGKLVSVIFSAADRARAPLTLYLKGTNFQVKVWEALLSIPPGAVTTYEAVARRIGEPGAGRAVGGAVGKNPVAFVIPCHRVIRKSGELGGYRWGTGRKRLILAWESAMTQAE
jgi:AraC family transcriptional regulator of adaptative response/methylated-DNA-[protein]-cysteine methyltransferase